MQENLLNILVVDDEDLYREHLSEKLSKYGKVYSASTKEQAKKIIQNKSLDIAFIDMNLHGKFDGPEIVKAASTKNIYNVALSAYGHNEIVELASDSGCNDYYSKGDEENSTPEIINRYFLNKNTFQYDHFFNEKYITTDEATKNQIKFALENSKIQLPILITGPTGIGKTVLARKIHELSKCEGEFIQLNCSEINSNVFESEIFGHKKGAFPGAKKNKNGRIKLADKGTLFLDEICSIPLDIQAKFLKVLEEKVFYPVGSTKIERSDFRLICTSQHDLIKKVQKGEFRQDLYYRINMLNLSLKPLKERTNDIKILFKKFLSGSRNIRLRKNALEKLQKYSWPGNIRELKAMAELLKSSNKTMISIDDLPKSVFRSKSFYQEGPLITDRQYELFIKIGRKEFMKQIQKELYLRAYNETKQEVTTTCRRLNISTNTFYDITEIKKRPRNIEGKSNVEQQLR